MINSFHTSLLTFHTSLLTFHTSLLIFHTSLLTPHSSLSYIYTHQDSSKVKINTSFPTTPNQHQGNSNLLSASCNSDLFPHSQFPHIESLPFELIFDYTNPKIITHLSLPCKPHWSSFESGVHILALHQQGKESRPCYHQFGIYAATHFFLAWSKVPYTETHLLQITFSLPTYATTTNSTQLGRPLQFFFFSGVNITCGQFYRSVINHLPSPHTCLDPSTSDTFLDI